MRRLLLTLALALSTAGAVAAPGVAGSGSLTDERGDVFGSNQSASLDIVRQAFGHSRGRLVHKVSVAGNAPDPASQQVPRLYIKTSNRANGTSECALFVGRHRGRLGVFTCGYGDRVASARIVRSSSHTIRYTFTPRAIGNPRSYEFAAITGPASGDGAGTTRSDRAPSADLTYHVHQLR